MKNDDLFSKDTADNYDGRWEKVAALKGALNLSTQLVLTELPADARLLCVGAGTGAELRHLAAAFPGWRFTVVEPAPAMMARCQAAVRADGIEQRCDFHAGYLDTLPEGPAHDAATCLLVTHFLPAAGQLGLLRQLAGRLRPGGTLVCAALVGDAASVDALRPAWDSMLRLAALPDARRERMLTFDEVHILPLEEVSALAVIAGFEEPTLFLQTLLIHGWFARRADHGGGAG